MWVAEGLLRIAILQNIWGHNPQIDLRLRVQVAKGLLRIARLQNILGGSRSGWIYVHHYKWVYGYSCALHCCYGSKSMRIGSTGTAKQCRGLLRMVRMQIVPGWQRLCYSCALLSEQPINGDWLTYFEPPILLKGSIRYDSISHLLLLLTWIVAKNSLCCYGYNWLCCYDWPEHRTVALHPEDCAFIKQHRVERGVCVSEWQHEENLTIIHHAKGCSNSNQLWASLEVRIFYILFFFSILSFHMCS